jgi:hypothetical protein
MVFRLMVALFNFLSLPVLAQQARACYGVVQALAIVRFIYSILVLGSAVGCGEVRTALFAIDVHHCVQRIL